jgi:dephospho-CoA kinase|eukprot:COSAG01_NODE_152_length_23937_cov_122.193976_30_plen_302_part_00
MQAPPPMSCYRGGGKFTGRGALDDGRLRVMTPDPSDQHFAHVTQVIQEQSSLIFNEGAAKPAQRSLWLAGNPGSGKTFLGDYLASRGWNHIDGDQGNQTEDADVKERWAKLYQAMAEHQAGKTEISEQLWRPYYDFLVGQYKTALAAGKHVVLSFALLGVFGEIAFLRSQIPGITFVVIEVDESILIERTIARNKAILETAGTTEEEVWVQDYMADYRKRYGEEYSPERYRQMEIDGAKEQTFVKTDTEDKSIVAINNDDFESFGSIKGLNRLVGLEWEDVDPKKIADVNMKRMENLNLEM